ncbi:Protein unc-13 homolog 4B (Protein Staccato) [Durusdinium trenchii]|uniref:Protein unc-13 homolog 4B (Protein Staccato) n=1 Tax=Durusdinium trenchii TaxID=1381693 RepID=A0ABP0QD36_9DINO
MPSPSRHVARLKVLIHSASNLPRGDEHGLSDPYVVCFLAEHPEPLFETEVRRQTLDPVWDEEHIVSPYMPGADLVFQVMDKDDTLKDLSERLLSLRGVGSDFLGEVRLAAEEFYPHGFEGDVMLEGVPKGRATLLRLRITVDSPQRQEFLPPPVPHAAQDEPEVNETFFDTAELELPKEEPSPKPRSSPAKVKLEKKEEKRRHQEDAEQRETSTSAPRRLGEVWQLSIAVLGAKNLFERCSSYCTVEVKGELRFSSRTHVVNDSTDPVWKKIVDFDYEAIEPIVLAVYQKEVWPKQDTLLGMAIIEAGDLLRRGSFEGELPLEGAEEGSVLCIEVSATQKRRVARQEHPHQRYLEEPKRLEPLSSAKRTAPHPADVAPKRLKILIQSFRGLHGLDLSTRRCFSCICAVSGRRHADLQTGGAFEAGYQTVWNLEGEITDYFPGEDLAFHVAAEGTSLEGSATMRCHQFFPFGFNSDLTMCSEGHGIIGLLRVKVTVEKDLAQPPRAPLQRTLGLQGTDGVRVSQQGDVWLRSLHPRGAMQSSLAVAAGSERHRLGETTGSVIRRKSPVRRAVSPVTVPQPASPVRRAASPIHFQAVSSQTSSPRAVATTLAPVVISPRKILHATHISAPITSGQLVPVVSQTPVVSAIHPPHIISQPIPSYTQVMQVTQPQLQQPIVQAPHGVVMHGYPGYSSQPASAPPPALPNPIPMTSYMGNDTGASVGALSLLAEAQASWRAGQCH